MALEKIVKNSSGVPTGEYERIAGGTLYADSPIGTILPYGGATAPNGWFLAQGQSISRTDYSELFAVIGTSFGVGDGSTTFNIPDMRESVPKGAGLTGHTVGAHLDADGLAVGEFLDDRLQNHRHNAAYQAQSGGTGEIQSGQVVGDNNYMTGYVREGRSGATTEVKSVGVNYIIKAKMVGVPADFLAKVDEAVVESMSPTSGTVELNTGWLGACKYSKSGNIVTLNFSQLRGNSTSVSTTIATLPSNLRPKESCYCVMWIDDTNNIQILNVTDTGAITVGGTAGVRINYAFGSVTFVTN